MTKKKTCVLALQTESKAAPGLAVTKSMKAARSQVRKRMGELIHDFVEYISTLSEEDRKNYRIDVDNVHLNEDEFGTVYSSVSLVRIQKVSDDSAYFEEESVYDACWTIWKIKIEKR